MPVQKENYKKINEEVKSSGAVLVAVSKTKPVADIQELYVMGHRHFGENYVQELVDKQAQLPGDICWHFIGHLQTNKVKYIAAFVHMIHGVDSQKLLKEINKQGEKHNRIISVLLQVHIAEEETKFGFDEQDLDIVIQAGLASFKFVRVEGLMGMASFSNDPQLVQKEFKFLKGLFDKYQSNPALSFTTLSMGMSGDYHLALANGSNLVRIGSLLFGERTYS